MRYDVQVISLTYQKKINVDVSQARRFFVSTAENFLQFINSDTAIRPYLHNYPFTNQNLDLILSFNNQQGNFPDPQYIACAFYSRGRVCYYKYDFIERQLKKFFEEPYEEALKIVNEM